MELTNEELQYLVNAIDTYIRNNGLAVATTGALLAKKLKAEVKTDDDK